MQKTEVLVVGTGMGALTAAALLTKKGKKVTVVEQKLPSRWLYHFLLAQRFCIRGRTTLVGLGDHMPLQYVLDETGIEINAKIDVAHAGPVKRWHIDQSL